MSEDSEKDLFTRTLWEIIKRESTLVNTHYVFFEELWEASFKDINPNPHTMRRFPAEKRKFDESIQGKIELLSGLETALIDGYYLIRNVVSTIFNTYFHESRQFIKDFKRQDRDPVRYMTAEKFIGSLLQFISSEQDLIDKKYIVVALNKSMMKLKGLSDLKIIIKLESNGFTISKAELQNIMYELEDHGVIEKHRIRRKDEEIYGKGTFFYKWIMDFDLPTESKQLYNKKILKLVDWSIQLWRSLYNIRELHLKVPPNYPNREFLEATLQKAAIQGFKSTWWVIKNIKKYYEMLLPLS
ncbi:MAG: hypothetical protein JW776_00650 [Candidatus Lokiarchaeota archaeon]|nr:hypothetical protein [Candidatus Lokiarchaeota archaeon]